MLRRLGFGVLAIGLPVAAFLTPRGIVVTMPVAAALFVAAAALDGSYRPLRTVGAGLAGSTGAAATLFGIVWAAVTLLWSPVPGVSGERLGSVLGSLAVGFAAYLALPDRMRASNMYLLPIGVAAAALLAIVVSLAGGTPRPAGGEDLRSVERGFAVAILFTWPAVAWLRSRDRDGAAILLVVVVCAATAIVPQGFAPVALSVGALTYVLAALGGARAALAVGAVTAAAVLVAPAIPFVLLSGFGGPAVAPGSWLDAVVAWRDVVAAAPGRLFTGHGFGTLLPARFAGLLPPATPEVLLVQVWHDLGVVGAAAVAGALFGGLRGAARGHSELLPGVAAAFASAFTLSSLGIGGTQAWWPAALSATGLVFVAAGRAQFRTRRPQAALSPDSFRPPVRAGRKDAA